VRVTDAHARIDDEGDDDQRQDADGVHERVSFGWWSGYPFPPRGRSGRKYYC